MGTVLEEAKKLTQEHTDEIVSVVSVWLCQHDEQIRLVEVDDTYSDPIGSTGEVLPFGFAAQPDLGYDHPTVLIVLSPEEWNQVQSGKLSLPEGWNKDELQCIYERTNETIKQHWLKQTQDSANEAMKVGASKDDITTLIQAL